MSTAPVSVTTTCRKKWGDAVPPASPPHYTPDVKMNYARNYENLMNFVKGVPSGSIFGHGVVNLGI